MIDTNIKTEAYIKNKECSKCKYQIIRTYKKDKNKTFLPIYLIIDKNGDIKGICRNCKSEIKLPKNFFEKKYILRFKRDDANKLKK